MKTYIIVNYLRLQVLTTVLLMLCGTTISAHHVFQDSVPVKYAVQAAQYCQEGMYEKAEEAIALAIASEAEKDALYTWYVKGFIHNEIYKARESTNTHSKHRDIAVEAFLKSKEMATGQPDIYNNNSALKYLANTYYNDAITTAGTFNLENETEADTIMEKYDALCRKIEMEGLNKAAFFKQKGMRYYGLWQKNICELNLNDKAFNCYQISADHDANDCDAYYNAAVVRYTLIQKLNNGSMELCKTALNENQTLENIINMLLPVEQKCKQHIGITNVLYNTYMLLGEDEKAAQYKNPLKP